MSLLIRADANLQIGTGHVMRCLALAQAWQDRGGSAAFLCAPLPPPLEARLRAEGMALTALTAWPGGAADAEETIRQAKALGAEWVVVDGYGFDAAYHKALKDAGLKLLVLDDNGDADFYGADLVLNQNIHACADWYAGRAPYTQLLLGTKYALLRREFRAWRNWQRGAPALAYKILVTLGGSDPDNVTLQVLQALSLVRADQLEATVVIGGSNPHRASLEAEAARAAFPVRLVTNAPNMPELMAWADLAVSAAGSTVWELAFLGVPTLLLVTADNQQGIARGLEEAGLAVNLGWAQGLEPVRLSHALMALWHDPEKRADISRRLRQLVDGQGASRVVQALQGKLLHLRRAEPDDCHLVWDWANAPDVRASSFSQALIPWEDHVAWFHAKRHNPLVLFYIGINGENNPIGLVRFDITGTDAVISMVIGPQFRGLGWGAALITEASLRAFRESVAAQLHAYIKPHNQASIRSFEKSGYVVQSQATIQGQPALHMVLPKQRPE